MSVGVRPSLMRRTSRLSTSSHTRFQITSSHACALSTSCSRVGCSRSTGTGRTSSWLVLQQTIDRFLDHGAFVGAEIRPRACPARFASCAEGPVSPFFDAATNALPGHRASSSRLPLIVVLLASVGHRQRFSTHIVTPPLSLRRETQGTLRRHRKPVRQPPTQAAAPAATEPGAR